MSLSATSSFADETFWEVQSVDTMKYSRDRARDKTVQKQIPDFVKKIAELGVTHIAINTPYDDEFFPTLKLWVQEARNNNLKVWFRGNWASWEGWFDYPRFINFSDHHLKTAEFIRKHKALFADGDIFTPAPEAENGGMGDPRRSEKIAQEFNQFLVDSYAACESAFFEIHIRVSCGYFSVNGDVAREILTKDTVEKTGKLVVIDHYVKTPEQLVEDIIFLHNRFGSQVVLGEYGAPIPSIHGYMTDLEQSRYLQDTFNKLLPIRKMIHGINYWTAFDGSTQLFTKDASPKPAAETIARYFKPTVMFGTITNTLGDKLSKVVVKTKDGLYSTLSDTQGNYVFALPSGSYEIFVQDPWYKTERAQVEITSSDQRVIQDFSLTPAKLNFLYRLRLNLKALFGI